MTDGSRLRDWKREDEGYGWNGERGRGGTKRKEIEMVLINSPRLHSGTMQYSAQPGHSVSKGSTPVVTGKLYHGDTDERSVEVC